MIIKYATSQLNYCFNYNSLYFSRQFWLVEQIYFLIIWREKTLCHSSNRLRAPYYWVVVWTTLHRWTVCCTLPRLSNLVRFVRYWVKSKSCFVLFTQCTRTIYFHRNRRRERKDISFRRAPSSDRVLQNDGLRDFAGNTNANGQFGVQSVEIYRLDFDVLKIQAPSLTDNAPFAKVRYEWTTFTIQKDRLG